MTCDEVEKLLRDKGRDGRPSAEQDALTIHVTSCRRCGEAMRIAGLASALFGALREEIEPGPSFYPRLHMRLAEAEISRPDATLLHALGLARQLIPALAMGVLLLAGVTLSGGGSRSTLPVQVRGGTDVYAFSLEEVNLPGVVGQPSRDQMLAFVLTQDDVRGPSPLPSATGRGSEGDGEVRDGSDDRDTR